MAAAPTKPKPPATETLPARPGMPSRQGEPALDAAGAAHLEATFFSGFQRGFERISGVPCPMDGAIYERSGDRELIRDWNEREEGRRHLLRTGSRTAPGQFPDNRGLQVTILRRPMFGQPQPKVCVIAACRAPLERLARGPVPAGTSPATMHDVEAVLEAALVQDRGAIFHYVGICSLTGWDSTVLNHLPGGMNFMTALVWPKGGGWLTHYPPAMPPELAAAFDPEDVSAKRARVVAVMRTDPDLQVPGSLLLLDELAERAVVPYVLAGETAWEYSQSHPEWLVRDVNGSSIVQRRAVRQER